MAMWRLCLQAVSGILGFWLADKYVKGVDFAGPLIIIPKSETEIGQLFGTLVFIGTLWGLLNFFVKPILKAITLPLRIITLNLFSLVIAMGLVWVIDILSRELTINGIIPLFWTTLILWGISAFLTTWLPDKK